MGGQMSDLRKAAEMALWALRYINQYSLTPHNISLPGEIDTAVDALRAALAMPEQGLQLVANLLKEYGLEALEVIAALKTQPEQGPVASLMTNIQSGDVKLVWNDEAFDRALWRETPLYTAPPQRKPLTDEALMALLPGAVRLPPGWKDFARAIEKAHWIWGDHE